MVEAYDILPLRPCFPLDTHEFARIDCISVMQGVRTLVSTEHDGLDMLHAIVPELSQQYAAAFVWVTFLAMAAKLFPF